MFDLRRLVLNRIRAKTALLDRLRACEERRRARPVLKSAVDRAESAKGACQDRMPFAQRGTIGLNGSQRRRVRLGINPPVEAGGRQEQKRMAAQCRVRKCWPLGYFFQERFRLFEPDLTQEDLRGRKMHRVGERSIPLRLLLRTVRCG